MRPGFGGILTADITSITDNDGLGEPIIYREVCGSGIMAELV